MQKLMQNNTALAQKLLVGVMKHMSSKRKADEMALDCNLPFTLFLCRNCIVVQGALPILRHIVACPQQLHLTVLSFE